MIALAREKGVSAFVGDGASLWPSEHRLDATRLFQLALERAEPGSRLHEVAEDGKSMRPIAEAIGRELGVPARSLAMEEAPAHFGWLAGFVMLDNPTSSIFSRDAMAWHPQGAGLLTGMRESGYLS